MAQRSSGQRTPFNVTIVGSNLPKDGSFIRTFNRTLVGTTSKEYLASSDG